MLLRWNCVFTSQCALVCVKYDKLMYLNMWNNYKHLHQTYYYAHTKWRHIELPLSVHTSIHVYERAFIGCNICWKGLCWVLCTYWVYPTRTYSKNGPNATCWVKKQCTQQGLDFKLSNIKCPIEASNGLHAFVVLIGIHLLQCNKIVTSRGVPKKSREIWWSAR